MRECIVRVNLNGQRCLREQQLKQQSRVWRFHIGALKPKLADRDTVSLDVAPRQEVGAPPRLAHNPRAGMFDRHDTLQVGTARIALARCRTFFFWTTRMARRPVARKRDLSPTRRRRCDRWLLLAAVDGYDAAYLLGRWCLCRPLSSAPTPSGWAILIVTVIVKLLFFPLA